MAEDRVLKPTQISIKQVRPATDEFGQQYTPDSDESKWSGDSPQDTRRAHSRADTDVGPQSLHHTLGPRRNQASPGNHIHDGTTSKKLSLRDLGIERNSVDISFTTLSSFTQAISFTKAYDVGVVPVVTCNINSGAGATARWMARAISISNTGFTLFLFKGDAADPAATWAAIPVQWTAVA